LTAAGQEYLKAGRAAALLGFPVTTLGRWESAGKLTAKRTAGGQRLYLADSVRALRRELGDPDTADGEKLLSTYEVAALFRVNPKTVNRWADAGHLGSVRTPGGHRRFRESVVQELLRDGWEDPQ
jgi:excisionase family DNA binding protein